jgi:secondary thiamine-phosphate synthase enzyme
MEFQVRSRRKIERIDITEKVAATLRDLDASAGAILVSLPHTTAAIAVGENWDPDVGGDIERALAAWVPKVPFDHGEGNSAAHFLSEAIGNSRFLPFEDGRPVLGRWQGIFLLEFDGPRERTVRVDALGALR